MPLVYTSLYFYFHLQSCYWKTGACEYSSVLLQQQVERSGSHRNNYLVYTLFMGWTAWKVPKFGKRCWKIPRKRKKKPRHDHIDLHLGEKPQKVTVTVTVLLGKTGQQQGHVRNSRWRQTFYSPLYMTCPFGGNRSVSCGACAQWSKGQNMIAPNIFIN